MNNSGWFSEYLSMLHDPAHILFEITLSIVFDFFIVYIGYQVVFKKIIVPKLRKEIHEEIDREHDMTHDKTTAGS